jgi:hypothetical protein
MFIGGNQMNCQICKKGIIDLTREDMELETLNYIYQLCGECYTEVEDYINEKISKLRKKHNQLNHEKVTPEYDYG